MLCVYLHLYEVMNPESIGDGVTELKTGDLKAFATEEGSPNKHFVPAYKFCHTSPTLSSFMTSIFCSGSTSTSSTANGYPTSHAIVAFLKNDLTSHTRHRPSVCL